MPLIKTKGLVIKQTDVGEYDRMLTVFTDTLGKISVSAKGARSMKRRLSGARVFSYSEFVLYQGSHIHTLSECTQIEAFFGLSNDLDALNSAAYICGFLDYAVQEHQENAPLLRLTLNCLHILSKGQVKSDLVLSVFRLRALCLSGFEPFLDGCAICGGEDGLHAFSVGEGGAVCVDCKQDEPLMNQDLLDVMKYVVSAPIERLFSFQISDHLADSLKKITISFVDFHTDFNDSKYKL